jgi:hypothetical protein
MGRTYFIHYLYFHLFATCIFIAKESSTSKPSENVPLSIELKMNKAHTHEGKM